MSIITWTFFSSKCSWRFLLVITLISSSWTQDIINLLLARQIYILKGEPLYPFHKQVVEVLSVANEWQRRACHSLLRLHINYNYRPPPFLAFVSLQLIREKEDEKMQMRHLQENGNRGLWQEQNADVSKAHKIGVHHDNSKNCAEAMTT